LLVTLAFSRRASPLVFRSLFFALRPNRTPGEAKIKCFCDETFAFSFPVFLSFISYLDPKFLESVEYLQPGNTVPKTSIRKPQNHIRHPLNEDVSKTIEGEFIP